MVEVTSKTKREARLCLVINRMATTTLHRPGAVIMYSGKECDAIRELSRQELDNYMGNQSKIEAAAAPDPGSPEDFVQKARSVVVLEALSKLDTNVDIHWTESGQPAVSAVSRALMGMNASNIETSRAEIRKFAPNFKRETKEGGVI